MTTMQMKLELVAVPVTDVDRAKAFYEDNSTAPLSPMKAYEEHRSGNAHSGVPHTPSLASNINVHSNKQQTHDKISLKEKQHEQRSTRF